MFGDTKDADAESNGSVDDEDGGESGRDKAVKSSDKSVVEVKRRGRKRKENKDMDKKTKGATEKAIKVGTDKDTRRASGKEEENRIQTRKGPRKRNRYNL